MVTCSKYSVTPVQMSELSEDRDAHSVCAICPARAHGCRYDGYMTRRRRERALRPLRRRHAGGDECPFDHREHAARLSDEAQAREHRAHDEHERVAARFAIAATGLRERHVRTRDWDTQGR